MIATLVLVAALGALGTPLARRLSPGASLAGNLGAGFLLGAAICTLAMQALTFASIAWSRASLVFTLGLLALGSALWARFDAERHELPPTARGRPAPAAARLLDALTALTILAHARYATHAAVVEWDYVAMWGQKAKVFYLARGIDIDFLASPERLIANADYPPLVPLLFDAQAILHGAWDDHLVGLISTAFGVGVLLMARDALRRTGLQATTLSLASLALSGAALSPWVGLAQGALLALLGAGWLAVREGVTSAAGPSGRWLILGGLLLGAATMAKNEGSAALAAALIATMFTLPWRRVPAAWARIGVPALLFALPWAIARAAWHLQPFVTQGNLSERVFTRLGDPLGWLPALVRYPPDHVVFWLIATAIVLVGARRAWRLERFLFIALVLQGLVYVLQNAAIPVDVVAHVKYSFHRLAGQLALPLGTLAILLVDRNRTATAAGWPEDGTTA